MVSIRKPKSRSSSSASYKVVKAFLLVLITGQCLYLLWQGALVLSSQQQRPLEQRTNPKREGKSEGKQRKKEDPPSSSAKSSLQRKSPSKDVQKEIEGGFVLDLVQERQTPHRRLPSVKETLRTLQNNDIEHEACEYYVPDDPDSVLRWRTSCSSNGATMAYNPAPFERYLSHCTTDDNETRLAPGATVACTANRQSRVFPLERPPVVLYDASAQRNVDASISTTAIPCNVPCEFETSLLVSSSSRNSMNLPDDAIVTLGVQNTDWRIITAVADPYYHAAAKLERTHYRSDIYYSTTNFASEVPRSFYNESRYGFLHGPLPLPAIDWAAAQPRATYILNDHCRLGNRGKWLKAVQAHLPVDTYGACHGGNAAATPEQRLPLLQQNRIVLALEAGTDKDYITDLVWEALASGAVPAILGASNLEGAHLPRHSALFATQFNSWDKFAQAVADVATNRTLYESYQQWRTDPAARAAWAQRYDFLNTAPECRLCRWAQVQLYGLRGWNHTLQERRTDAAPESRSLCFAGPRLVHPFREVWPGDPASVDGTPKCTAEPRTDRLTIQDHIVERTIAIQDGVVDLTFRSIQRLPSARGDLVLRLVWDGLDNTDGAYFPDTHVWLTEAQRTPLIRAASLQDARTKVTVLANWQTPGWHSPAAGVMQVTVAAAEVAAEDVRRIRVITEDVNPLHDKLTEFYPSAYGRRMMHDFIDPVQYYIAATESVADA